MLSGNFFATGSIAPVNHPLRRTLVRLVFHSAYNTPVILTAIVSCLFSLSSCKNLKNNISANNKDYLTYHLIPAGSYMMGCVPGDTLCTEEEKPQHLVTIKNNFYISTTEITIGAFRKFLKATHYIPKSVKENKGRIYVETIKDWQWTEGINWEHPYQKDSIGKDNWPVTQVSYTDAEMYCKWVGGRLSTEEEWEYAARGGLINSKYPWGDEWPPVKNNQPLANTADKQTHQLFPSMESISSYNDGFKMIAPVASFPPNGFGLYDMAGNVWEWTSTRFLHGYANDNIDSSFIKYDTRIVKGGAWCYYPYQLRCSERGYFQKDNFWTGSLGFRCVIDSIK